MDDSAVVHQSGGGAGDEEEEEICVFTAERYFSGADVDALWCARSSSSLSSAFKNGGQLEYWSADPTTLTAATSSSEASWNNRSVLLRGDPTVSAAVESEEPSGAGGDRSTPRTKASPSPSTSHNLLLRWLIGVAACACAGGGGVEEAVTTDECHRDEARAAGVALGEEKRSTHEADAAFPGRKSKQTAEEEVATARVRPGMCDSGATMPPPLQLAEPRRIRAADAGEVSARVLNPRAAAALADERLCRSLNTFPSARQQNSAFTIVAGSTAARDGAVAAGSAAGNPDLSLNKACATCRPDSGAADDAAWDELECVYPPSDASVVWSVVTADGVASAGNFSSAASGYYHHYSYPNGGGGGQHTAAGKNNRRRSAGGRANGSGLLMMGCMSDRAVDANSPARVVHRRPPPP